MQLGVQERSRG